MNDTMEMAFNFAMTAVAVLGGWVLKSIVDRIKKLEDADYELANQVANLRVELPSYYVRRDDFVKLGDNLFAALRRIEEKIDGKADKAP